MFQKEREYECHACRRKLVVERKPGRRDDCPHCGAELHVCLNCALFDDSLTRGCREPQAEEVRDRERANFCGWFEFRQARVRREDSQAGRSEAERFFKSSSAAPELMKGLQKTEPERNPLASFFEPVRKDTDAERSKAESDFDALFRKK